MGQNVTIEKAAPELSFPGKVYRSRAWGKRLIIIFSEMTNEQYAQLVNYIIDRQEKGFGGFEQRSINLGLPSRRKLTDQVRRLVRGV